MKIEFVTKNYVPRDHLKRLIETKLSRLDKFFDKDVSVKVTLKKAASLETLELTIMLDGMILRSEVYSGNMFENIDIALPKLEKQIIKHRDKLNKKSKKVNLKNLQKDVVPEIHDTVKHAVVKSKKFNLKPLAVEDAIDELELSDHSFYVFLNKATSNIAVLYTRHDGEYGLIETVVE